MHCHAPIARQPCVNSDVHIKRSSVLSEYKLNTSQAQAQGTSHGQATHDASRATQLTREAPTRRSKSTRAVTAPTHQVTNETTSTQVRHIQGTQLSRSNANHVEHLHVRYRLWSTNQPVAESLSQCIIAMHSAHLSHAKIAVYILNEVRYYQNIS